MVVQCAFQSKAEKRDEQEGDYAGKQIPQKCDEESGYLGASQEIRKERPMR